MKIFNAGYVALCVLATACNSGGNTPPKETLVSKPVNNNSNKSIIVYPAPANERLNATYKVSADGQDIAVYNVKAPQILKNSRDTAEFSGMAYFDFVKGPVTVTVSVDAAISKAEVLPASLGITPEIKDKSISFQIDKPQNLDIQINGDPIHQLHLFVNPEETDVPNPKDPDVVYFGPGSYRLPQMELEDGMTVYIAGGAVVHCYVGPHEWYTLNDKGYKNYNKFYTFDLTGKNITFRGRGIVDQDGIPAYGRRSVLVKGENIKVEGVIFRSPSEWTVVVESSKNVSIDNIKIIGYRPCSQAIMVDGNSDVIETDNYILVPQ
ncbi:hypothetical protein AGMMS49574_22820 [Bacteroidia bacterium]|nr:hypothetical protein AGMMS49574_22820 [Bacteroidia bacterium]